MSQSPELNDLVIFVDIRLEEIEIEVAKLRQAVIDGRYDARSLAGDAVLRIEGQLKQIRRKIPKSEL